MISDVELRELERQAIEADKLLGAKERYETALGEKQKAEAREKLEAQINELENDLDSKSERYKTHLEEVSEKFRELLAQLYATELEFTKLAKEADSLSLAANSLAQFKAKRGDFNQIAKSQGLDRIDKAIIDGAGSDEIRKRFKGMGNPLYFSFANLKMGDLGLYLLSAPFWQNIIMQFLGKPAQSEVAKPEVTQPGIVKTNGVVKPPIEAGDKRTLSQEEFLKLWTSPPR